MIENLILILILFIIVPMISAVIVFVIGAMIDSAFGESGGNHYDE
ncbi:hypothetical protein [Pasteurella testudinis]|nr:hypothetical protein [Pasteurella testudinis]